MKDPERSVPEAERVKDLEVGEDEAREIAGGKKPNPLRRGKSANPLRYRGTEPGKHEA